MVIEQVEIDLEREGTLKRTRHGFVLLLEAFRCAAASGWDRWEFAVEIKNLEQRGLNKNDLRWLLVNQLAEHALEYSRPNADSRCFRRVGSLYLPPASCFVLTPLGVSFVERLIAGASLMDSCLQEAPQETRNEVWTDSLSPQWDARDRVLYFGTTVVKTFRVPAPSQELILTVFQEEDWPPEIDDPLPPQRGQNSKTRLHNTINSLNRTRVVPVMKFSANGRGDGIRWSNGTPIQSKYPPTLHPISDVVVAPEVCSPARLAAH